MKPTLKSINASLPRFDYLRRNWMKHGMTGFAKPRGYLKAAFADIGEDGNVKDIMLYSVGDAMEQRHYHQANDAVDITGIIEDIIREDTLHGRAGVVKDIQEIVALDTHRRELFDGQKVMLGEYVYWANMVRMEIYRMHYDSMISGVINGYKVADIIDFRITKCKDA